MLLSRAEQGILRFGPVRNRSSLYKRAGLHSHQYHLHRYSIRSSINYLGSTSCIEPYEHQITVKALLKWYKNQIINQFQDSVLTPNKRQQLEVEEAETKAHIAAVQLFSSSSGYENMRHNYRGFG